MTLCKLYAIWTPLALCRDWIGSKDSAKRQHPTFVRPTWVADKLEGEWKR